MQPPCVRRFAGKFEWFTLWLLTADHRGLVTKEAVRAVYDGSLFYMMERKWAKGETVCGDRRMDEVWKRGC